MTAYQKSNALLSDLIINYRTVISFGQKNVDRINQSFEELLVDPMKNVIQKSNKMGLYYALGTTGKLLFISIVFLLGAELLVSTWGIE